MNTKRVKVCVLALVPVLGVGVSGGPGAAQVQMQACGSQQSIEQLMETEGALVPDDCRPVTVTRLARDIGDLCVIDLSGTDNGVVDGLLAAATTTQWWIACSTLSAGAEQ